MKYFILSMLCLAAMIAYVHRLALSNCEQQIRTDLLMEKATLGQIMAAWQLGYALLQLPSGWLADRWGSRKSLCLFIVGWSTFMGLAPFCRDYWSLLIVWTGMGMAQAGVFPCATKLIGEWFESTRRATASGLLASAMSLGIALAPLMTTQLLASGWSWQQIFWLYLVPGWFWAFAFLATTPSRPFFKEKRSVSGTPSSNVPSPDQMPQITWAALLTSIPLWLLCGQQFFRAAAMMFFQNWFPTFLRETRGVDLAGSGRLAFIVGVGALLGGMSGGLVSDWILKRTGNRRLARQGIAIFGMLSCSALIGLSAFIQDTNLAIGCITLGAYLATFGGISGYTMAIEFGGQHVASVFSLMNMCGNIGAALFPLWVGYIADSGLGWNGVLVLSILILIIDAYCWAVLNPKTTISGEGFTDDANR